MRGTEAGGDGEALLAPQVSPSLNRLLNESRYEELFECLKQALAAARSPGEAAEHLASLGKLHALWSQWGAAAGALSQAVNLGLPQPGAVLADLIKYLGRGGFHAAVLDLCDKLGGSNDFTRSRLLVQKARAHWGLGQETEARSALDAALALDPASPLALVLRDLLGTPSGGARIIDMLTRPAECAPLLASDIWTSVDWAPNAYARDISLLLLDAEDASFVIVDEKSRPLLRCDLCIAPGRMAGFGAPIRVRPARDVGDQSVAARLALNHLMALQKYSETEITIAEPALPGGGVSAFGRTCLKRGGTPQVLVSMDVDLTRPEEALWSQVRKSYRSLIRRGERELEIRLYDGDHADASLFEHFRQLHYAHFRTGQPDHFFLTLGLLRTMAQNRRLELSVGWLGQRPVAATIVVDEERVTTYYAARYAKDVAFDVSPSSVWSALMRARQRGQRRFHLGVWDNEQCKSQKFRDIAFFKSGFTDDLRYQHVWRFTRPA